MRDIRFRAWYPNEAAMGKRGMLHNVHSSLEGQSLNDLILEVGEIGIVLMQYTGLKDKNGKEIYEGDILIISIAGGTIEILADVSWNNDEARFVSVPKNKLHQGDSRLAPDYYTHYGEVIGNIYENPELIKV